MFDWWKTVFIWTGPPQAKFSRLPISCYHASSTKGANHLAAKIKCDLVATASVSMKLWKVQGRFRNCRSSLEIIFGARSVRLNTFWFKSLQRMARNPKRPIYFKPFGVPNPQFTISTPIGPSYLCIFLPPPPARPPLAYTLWRAFDKRPGRWAHRYRTPGQNAS